MESLSFGLPQGLVISSQSRHRGVVKLPHRQYCYRAWWTTLRHYPAVTPPHRIRRDRRTLELICGTEPQQYPVQADESHQ
jgi:hypothetical protein